MIYYIIEALQWVVVLLGGGLCSYLGDGPYIQEMVLYLGGGSYIQEVVFIPGSLTTFIDVIDDDATDGGGAGGSREKNIVSKFLLAFLSTVDTSQ